MENDVIEKNATQVVEDKMEKYKRQKNIELYKSYRVFSYDNNRKRNKRSTSTAI